jgi:hypothetical protein
LERLRLQPAAVRLVPVRLVPKNRSRGRCRPNRGSHSALAVDEAEKVLGELMVRSSPGQADRLCSWAAEWPDRTWPLEGACGLGYLLAHQLRVFSGEELGPWDDSGIPVLAMWPTH